MFCRVRMKLLSCSQVFVKSVGISDVILRKAFSHSGVGICRLSPCCCGGIHLQCYVSSRHHFHTCQSSKSTNDPSLRLSSLSRRDVRHLHISSPTRAQHDPDQQTVPAAKVLADPGALVATELGTLAADIRNIMGKRKVGLVDITDYHFDGKGKSFRPMVVLLVAKACNQHRGLTDILAPQKKIAMIAEMIHTASLVHDDVIDESETRRGQASIQTAWGQRQAILAGDFILSVASVTLARLRDTQVVSILSQVLEDLVSGEFMQLGSKEDETERFNHYLKKTYKKTASLIANSCKAVAVVSQCGESAIEHAFQYGRNIGIAFQLVDDLLDFISSEKLMGKPTAADLKLGLATAPVLFAAHQHSELNAMIVRRFSQPGDVELAWKLVAQSDGVSHTRYLAEQHCKEAIRHILQLTSSPEQQALVRLTEKVLNRLK